MVLKSRVTTCQALRLVFSKPRVTQYLRCLTIVNMVTTLYDVDLYRHVYNILYTVAVATLYFITKSAPCNKNILVDWRGLQKVLILHYKLQDVTST